MSNLESEFRKKAIHALKEAGFRVVPLTDKHMHGIPDLLVWGNMRRMTIELKRAVKFKAKPLQIFYRDDMRRNGAEAYIVNSMKAIEQIINNKEVDECA